MDLILFLHHAKRLNPVDFEQSKDIIYSTKQKHRQAFLTVLRLGFTYKEAKRASKKYTAAQIELYYEQYEKLIK